MKPATLTTPAVPLNFTLATPGPRAQLRVDRAAGTIAGLSLITANVEAKGHGIWMDAETLNTALAVIQERGGRLKCAIKHLSLLQKYTGEGDRIAEFPGWFSALAVAGNHLVAGRLEFFDDFKTGDNTRRLFKRILEMAEKTPDLFGLSIEGWGYTVFVAEDGTEYSERPKDVPLKYDGLPVLRVTDLAYASFVDEPAANPAGLYARFSARHPALAKILAPLAAVFGADAGAAVPPAPPATNPPAPAPVVFAGKQPAAEPRPAAIVAAQNLDDQARRLKASKAAAAASPTPADTRQAEVAALVKAVGLDEAARRLRRTDPTLATRTAAARADLSRSRLHPQPRVSHG